MYSFVILRRAFAAAAALAFVPAASFAQAPDTAAVPKVGTQAPDFSAPDFPLKKFGTRGAQTAFPLREYWNRGEADVRPS